MNFLNLTKGDVKTIREYFECYYETEISLEFMQLILYKSYRLYAHKFKDSHRAILKYKLKMKGHLSIEEISDKFGIPIHNIHGRWRDTVRKRLKRYVEAAILYNNKPKRSSLDQLDIIAICDLSTLAVSMLDWYGIHSYKELKDFIDSYRPDICQRISGTNFGIETYRELIVAEALIRKDFPDDEGMTSKGY